MASLTSIFKTLAAAAIICTATPASAADEPEKSTLDQIKAALDELKKLKSSQPQTVNTNTLAIESWLLTSTAIDATAARIHDAVASKVGVNSLVVLAGTEALEGNQVGMMKTEMSSLSMRLNQASSIKCTQTNLEMLSLPAAIGAASALVDLLKTQTDLTPISQSVDAKLLAASVAGNFHGKAILPTAAIAAGAEGELLKQFRHLTEAAVSAQEQHDALAANQQPSDCQKEKLKRLKSALAAFDTFYARATTAKDGAVPIIVADRLDRMLGEETLVLRVNTEAAGGTLLKRTNLLTALGAETAFVSGGLVSSYQLTDPRTGSLIKAGVVTCRTTLASLKRVQQGSWSAYDGRTRGPASAVCEPKS